MPHTILLLALLLEAFAAAPALAQFCDDPCDDGEVWSDERGTCIPEPKPTS